MTKVNIPIKGLPIKKKKTEEELLSSLKSNNNKKYYCKRNNNHTEEIHPWPFELEQDINDSATHKQTTPSPSITTTIAEEVSKALNNNKDIINKPNSFKGNIPTKDTENTKLCNLDNEATEDEIKSAEAQELIDHEKVNLAQHLGNLLASHPKKDEFQIITDKMHDIYLAKNNDYDSSFNKTWDKYGFTSLLIRLEDKINRLESLTKKQPLVKTESVEDTLTDLANYAILGILKLKSNKNTI